MPRWLTLFAVTLAAGPAVAAEAPDFNRDVLPVFRKYCNGCHNGREQEGGLVLEDFARAMKGGEHGVAIAAGDSAKSRLWKSLSPGGEPKMPPEDAPQPKAAELAVIKAWIDAGAKPPAGGLAATGLVTPKVEPQAKVREPVTALAASPTGQWLAVARPDVVEIVSLPDRKPLTTLTGHTGAIADVQISRAGDRLVVAAGETGLAGEATIWNTSDWSRVATIAGHRDSLYAVAFSPDGETLATAGYDREVRTWNAKTGEPRVTMTGHNDAVYALAFHPDGKLLATASGDRTVKLWNVATGERLDTFIQPAKEQYSVTFSPNGKHIAAGGVDCRVRVWEITEGGKEGTNPILYARFAHEAPILRVLFSPDGRLLVSCSEERRIKVWETKTFTQVALLERQTDWPAAICFAPDSRTLYVGRMNGELAAYPVNPSWADSVTDLVALPESPAATNDLTAPMTAEVAEVEPNDAPAAAQSLTLPAMVSGKFQNAAGLADRDLYRFASKAGQVWMLETNAGRSKSPADTKLEVLHADGRPVQRAVLQAVRDSWVNFRPIDSSQLQIRVEFWEEMDLDEYLYMNGEIGKFHRAPRGPDSGYDFYDNAGKRRTYFDTTAIAHAKDEPIYIVEAYPPTANLVENGLPVFPLYYVNDDDGERELGSDSRLTFTAPADGEYLVRVTDTRDFQGESYTYKLTVRPPKPDFDVKV
ncbi:MAG: c-type cytochrome domain-containing protein, partial [Planctomycetaceae bacterium]|nr:c-type cytochrome domain-containing protein [Planctomycetaceae bacterium]